MVLILDPLASSAYSTFRLLVDNPDATSRIRFLWPMDKMGTRGVVTSASCCAGNVVRALGKGNSPC